MGALHQLFAARRRRAVAARSSVRRRPPALARLERLEDRAVLAAFTPGNLVIYRVGTGAASLAATATEVFLDEYGPNGSLVQSIAMPTADSGSNKALTASGTSTSEGQITRSTDGKFIVATGYAAAPGTASIATSAAATVNRVIGRIAADGTIDTSTTTTSFSGASIRSAASVDGTSFWASGSNTGVVYQPYNAAGTAGTLVSSNVTNLRNIGIFGDQLYVSSASGSNRMLSVGTGLPTTTGQTATQLPGFPTTTPSASPYGFFFADLDAGVAGLDTLYVADSTAGAIQKYALVSGSWTARGTATAASVFGLAGTVSGTTVTLYATSATSFSTLVDSTGYNQNLSGAVTSRVTAAANTAFRGIALAPEGGSVVVVVPTVTASSPSSVTNNSATLNGNVTDAGGAQVTARGFVYSVTSVNSNPVIGGPSVIQQAAGTGPGAFNASVASLLPNTTYTVKSYATNSAGTAYSSVVTFTTNSVTTIPVVTSPTSSAILDIDALLGGTVTSDGGTAVTERGIVIANTSVNGNPEIGGDGVTKVPADAAGLGTFTKLVSGLTAGTNYSFKAYAINSVGTAYSDVATFNTAVAATAPTLANPTATSIGSTTATLGGQVTGNGGRPVTERGVIYAKKSVNADPVIGGTGVTVVPGTLGIGTGTFTVAVTGLEKLTDYVFKAYATSTAGTGYTLATEFTTYDTATPLTAGDIAFTGFDPAGNDKLSFVLLKPVIAGTTIALTDNGWTGSALTTNEGSSTITFLNPFTAGTVFDFDGNRTAGTRWLWGSNTGSPSGVGVSDVTSNFQFAAGGDSVLAYQGAAPTSGTDANWVAGFASQAWVTSGTISTNTSYLPAALVDGSTAFSLNAASGANQAGELKLLDPNPVTGTPAAIRTTVYTPTNWSTTVAPFPELTTFVVTTPSATIGTTGTFSPLSTTYGTNSGTSSITVTGSGLTGNITATAPAGFQVSSDGTTFGSTATIVQSGGTASGTLFVRVPATTGAGTVSGTVVLSATGATSVNAAVPASTVAKKGLTVAADNTTREWNQPNAFTATITGFVNGETASVLTGSPSLTSAATSTSAPGTYAIVAAIGTLASSNYDFTTFTDGTLTVTVATVVFDVPLGTSVTDTTVRTGFTQIVKRGAGTLTLNQANSYVSGTLVEAGTLVVGGGDALGTGATTVNPTATLQVGSGITLKTQTVTIAGGTLAGAGATLLVNATTGIGTLAVTALSTVTGSPSLVVSGNGVVTLPTALPRQLVGLTALSVDQATGGKLDIGRSRIDVAAGGVDAAALRASLQAGRIMSGPTAGTWTGTNGIVTTGGTVGSATLPAVGYRVLGTGAAIVAWAAFGDTNLDGVVNTSDLTLINNGGKFGQGSASGAVWSQGDFNYSNGVLTNDLSLLNNAQMFLKGSYVTAAPAGTASTPASGPGSVSQEAWIALAIDAEIQRTTRR